MAAAATRLPVILLWHMHQPQYRDALTGQYELPWTYLHAVKDYTDMAAHLEGSSAARAVVNFTPLLIEQLDEIARRIAEHLEAGAPLPDPMLALLGPDPVPMEPAQRLELLRGCLRAQRKQMIERFGPYLELATIAETLGTPERIPYASDQFIHDLAVWYHLAWLGETVRRTDPLVARLTERGRDFSAALQLLAAAGGFRWAASGAAVLRGSLELTDAQAALDPLAFSRPYRLAGTGMDCFFRDDMLSDLIGFTYATWHGDDAVANLTNELTQLARRYEPGGNHAVLIALDGENAWEHYPFNGFYFLRALYEKLAEHPELELMTLSECLARGIQPAPLPQVMAGSWVHGTLATWMGDAAKNRAWDLLCDAKGAYDRVTAELRDPAERAAAGRQLALCESSDWFWWFGDYNPADAVSQFDRLYRRQLLVLYRRLNLAPPPELALPISEGHGAPEHGGVMRRATAG